MSEKSNGPFSVKMKKVAAGFEGVINCNYCPYASECSGKTENALLMQAWAKFTEHKCGVTATNSSKS